MKDLNRILKIGQETNFAVIVDCPGKILKEVFKSRPLLIKPNLIEFQEMTGSKAKTKQAVIKEARKLNKYVPLICISSVEGGALLVSQDEAWFGQIPNVKVNSVVGAGDSMVGAMTAHLWQYGLEDLGVLLKWGLAAACASLTHEGTDLGQAAEIRKYFKKTKVTQVQERSE